MATHLTCLDLYCIHYTRTLKFFILMKVYAYEKTVTISYLDCNHTPGRFCKLLLITILSLVCGLERMKLTSSQLLCRSMCRMRRWQEVWLSVPPPTLWYNPSAPCWWVLWPVPSPSLAFTTYRYVRSWLTVL